MIKRDPLGAGAWVGITSYSAHVVDGLFSIGWDSCEAKILAWERVNGLTTSASRVVLNVVLVCTFLDGFFFGFSPCVDGSTPLCWVESVIRLAWLGFIELCSQLLELIRFLDAENVCNALWIWFSSIVRLWLMLCSFPPIDGVFLFWGSSPSSDDALVYWGLSRLSDMLDSSSDLIISSSVERSLRIKSLFFEHIGVFGVTTSPESLAGEGVLFLIELDVGLVPFPEWQIGWFVMSTWLDMGLWGMFSSCRELRSSSLIFSSRLCCFWVALFFRSFKIGRFLISALISSL